MKKLAMILCLTITIILCQFGLIAATASVAGLHSYTDEVSAASRILIYHQGGSQQADWQSKVLA